MAVLLSIDPGSRNAGAALWVDRVLVKAWAFCPGGLPFDPLCPDRVVDALVIERPVRHHSEKGREVRVETAGQVVVGTAVGLETDGALRVRLESGADEVLHVGDVQLVQYR